MFNQVKLNSDLVIIITVQNSIDEYMIRVKDIEKQYKDDVKILKRMNGDNDTKKKKNSKYI